jgi:lysyl-tRNA synthetase class I
MCPDCGKKLSEVVEIIDGVRWTTYSCDCGYEKVERD